MEISIVIQHSLHALWSTEQLAQSFFVSSWSTASFVLDALP